MENKLIESERLKIATELRFWMQPKEVLAIASMKKDELISLHHTLGKDIRNEFELWIPEHHITKMWFDQGSPFDHPCHPDNFSFSCIVELWALLQSSNKQSLQ